MGLLSVFPTKVLEKRTKIYNLDMILSVGYRVNSKRGIAFRRWANSVLKQFTLMIVESRLEEKDINVNLVINFDNVVSS